MTPYLSLPFPETYPATGGDSATENLNLFFQTGDVAFILVATSMVWLMVPGIAFFYSGLARRKSALSMLWICMVAVAITQFQWYFWGFSLAFSKTATNGFIGNLKHFALMDVLGGPATGTALVPELLYANFQGMFASVTIALVMGAVAERGRLMPACLFIFLWVTLVYCPMACAVWNANGWAFKWGVLDYAGGGPVEIGSGFGALAYSFMLGPRRNSPSEMVVVHRPHSVTSVVLGTALLWFGWAGFNGGSAFGANLRAVISITDTNIAGAMGGITWCLLDYRLERSLTMVGFCSGVIAGLVAATPSSGYIGPSPAVAVGVLAGACCNYATKIKFLLKIDDSMDVFAEHGVGGIIGLLCCAFFGAEYVTALDGVSYGIGGWFSKNWAQMYKQLGWIGFCCAWTWTITCLICFVINKIPGLHLRTSEDGELRGIDEDQIGEFAFDYVEARRNFMTWGVTNAIDGETTDEGSDFSNQKGKAKAAEALQNAGSYEMQQMGTNHSLGNAPFPAGQRQQAEAPVVSGSSPVAEETAPAHRDHAVY
ncbi:ammonium transporter MEP2 [Protomyces lactucae-debilis]|uniref:Ammonium transporter n=1 Tax=Protomyces lactucae-debilis TaxID=2754530 RepID=A0A1Y2FU71_PROLT|nr:ammonium transporter MEP2 [Protomyces lactucae-debilis]ORY87542.1 ammonium transporter MEP2 [Protomyces lactucae-debilis]